MNNQRAVYQPLLENVPGYDLADDDEAEGKRSRLPLLIVIALIVLAAFAGVVWLAYNQGVARGQAGTQIVVAAPDGPVRTEPTDAGGVPTPYLGLKVYQDPLPPDAEAQNSSLAQNSASSFGLPPPISQQAAATTEAPPARLDPAPAAPPVVAPAPPPPPAASAAPRQLAAPPPVAAPPQPAAAPPGPPPAVVAAATPPPAPTPPPPAARPVAPPAAAPAATAAATAGAAVLQVGAYESEQIANGAFSTFQSRYGAVAGGLSPDIQKADLGARGVWYRLRVGPFADRATAAATCERLKAAGGNCLIAAP